ncbi:MAG TPA: hypothetical protein VK618_12515 [Flavitalea sp.]|nr:hypothetical protein [Flavitalea sp.]
MNVKFTGQAHAKVNHSIGGKFRSLITGKRVTLAEGYSSPIEKKRNVLKTYHRMLTYLENQLPQEEKDPEDGQRWARYPEVWSDEIVTVAFERFKVSFPQLTADPVFLNDKILSALSTRASMQMREI